MNNLFLDIQEHDVTANLKNDLLTPKGCELWSLEPEMVKMGGLHKIYYFLTNVNIRVIADRTIRYYAQRGYYEDCDF